MSSWTQARAFSWLHLLTLAGLVAAVLASQIVIAIVLGALSVAVQIAAIILCRCPTCGKPPHFRGGPEDWLDWLRPWVRLWPEEVCSRCDTDLVAT